MSKVNYKNSLVPLLLFSLIYLGSVPIIVRGINYIDVEFNLIDARANNYTASDQKHPSLCALNNETFAIFWESYGQEGGGPPAPEYGIYGTVIEVTTGNNVTAEFLVNDYTSYNQRYSSICALTDEIVAVAWSSWNQDGSFWGVYTKVINVITGIDVTSEIAVNQVTTGYQYEPSICALSDDTFAIAWHSNQDALQYDVYARVFNATTGTGITSEFRVNNYTTGSQQRPSVSTLTEDSFVVTWESSLQDSDGYGVFGVVIDAATGNNLTKTFQVNEYIAYDQWFSSVCSLDDEKIAVAWRDAYQDGNGTGVYAIVIDTTTGNNVTAELQMNEYNEYAQQNPSICALSSDLFMVAWESGIQDGNGYGVYIRAVNVTTGMPIFSEVQVNNFTTGNQWVTAICALSEKNVVVAWESAFQDGDGFGVYFSSATLIASTPSNGSTSIPGYDFYFMVGAIGLSLAVILRKFKKK
jgi:hypothetical protein